MNFAFLDQEAPVRVQSTVGTNPKSDLFPIENIREFLSRPIPIPALPLKGFSRVIIPSLVKAHPIFHELLRHFALVRFDLIFDVIWRTTKLHYGEYIIAWIPYPEIIARSYHSHPLQLVQFPHIAINMGVSTRYQMKIPYVGQQEYLAIRSPFFENYGMIVGNALVGYPQVSIRGPTMQMYVRLDNVQFGVPIPRTPYEALIYDQDWNYATRSKTDIKNNGIAVADKRNMAARAKDPVPVGFPMWDYVTGYKFLAQSSNKIYDKPILGVISGRYTKTSTRIVTTIKITDTNGKVTVYKAQMLSGLSAISKAVSTTASVLETSVTAIKQVGLRVGWIQEAATKVMMGPESTEFVPHPDSAGAPHTGLASRIREFHYIYARDNLNPAAGAVITVIPVAPTTCPVITPNGVNCIGNHPLAHMSRMFKRWRGTLKYKFRFYGSVFMAGQFRVVWVPAPNEVLNSLYQPIMTVDVTQTTEFIVTVPFFALKRYLAVGAPNGFLVLVRETVTVNQASEPIDKDFYLTIAVAAGDDLEFSAPTTQAMLFKPAFNQSSGRAAGNSEFQLMRFGIMGGHEENSRVAYFTTDTGLIMRLVKIPMPAPGGISVLPPDGLIVSEAYILDQVTGLWTPYSLHFDMNDIPDIFYVHYPDIVGTKSFLQYKASRTHHWRIEMSGELLDLPQFDAPIARHNEIVGFPYLDCTDYPNLTRGEKVTFLWIAAPDGSSMISGSIYKADNPTYPAGDLKIATPLDNWVLNHVASTGNYTAYVIVADLPSPDMFVGLAYSYSGSASSEMWTLSHIYKQGDSVGNDYAHDGLTPLDMPQPTIVEYKTVFPAHPYYDWTISSDDNDLLIMLNATVFQHWSNIMGIFWTLVDADAIGRELPYKFGISASSEDVYRFVWIPEVKRHYFYYTDCEIDFVSNLLFVNDSVIPLETTKFDIVRRSGTYTQTLTYVPILSAGEMYLTFPGLGACIPYPAVIPKSLLVVPPRIPVVLPHGSFIAKGWDESQLVATEDLYIIQDGQLAAYLLAESDTWRWNFVAQTGEDEPGDPAKANSIVEVAIVPSTEPVDEDIAEKANYFDDSIVLKMAAYIGTVTNEFTFINPLAPLPKSELVMSYLDWVRAAYMFCKGNVTMKMSGTRSVTATLIPFCGGYQENAGRFNTKPPSDVLNELSQWALRKLASTASLTQVPSETPMEIVVPYMSDSIAIFNHFADVISDNNYTSILLSLAQAEGSNTFQKTDVYLAAADNFTFHWPIPPPPLVPNVWASLSKSEKTEYLNPSTSESWWDWIKSLVSRPIQTVVATAISVMTHSMISLGYYNNYAIPGTVANFTGQYYY